MAVLRYPEKIHKIVTKVREDMRQGKRHEDIDRRWFKDFSGYFYEDYSVIYSKYLLPLEHDCSMHHYADWAKATGLVFIDNNNLKKHRWSIEYECPRDGLYEAWSNNLCELMELILSDERNYIKIL